MSIEFISRDYEAFLQELKDHIRNAAGEMSLKGKRWGSLRFNFEFKSLAISRTTSNQTTDRAALDRPN